MTRTLLVVVTLLGGGTGCRSSSAPEIDPSFQLAAQPVATGLTNPVYLTAPAGDARLFIVEQPGRIRIVKGDQLLPTPFLDISARVAYGGERGLLSMTFDPAYASNGFFFVYYTNTNGDIAIERYGGTVGADVASPTPASVITIPHPGQSNHNGGLLTFGPDGFLYAGTGDGGGGGDRALPYTIPSTNPFVNQAGRRGEIWAYGLRNPWRYAFDRHPTAPGSDLFIADVGQNAYEEVDVVSSAAGGINYGWNAMEGTHCYPGGVACSSGNFRLPEFEYDHSRGCSITGGFVYRGSALPEVSGQYFYSDYCTGFLASLSGSVGGGFTSRDWNVGALGNVLSFGEDASGDLYVLSGGGAVYRLVRK
jgi:glucose/arabinose dehydrogenase